MKTHEQDQLVIQQLLLCLYLFSYSFRKITINVENGTILVDLVLNRNILHIVKSPIVTELELGDRLMLDRYSSFTPHKMTNGAGELFPEAVVVYISTFPRHVEKCCDKSGHMTEADAWQ
jgi:hypothetical protein